MPAKRVVVRAEKDENTRWAWGGGYVVAGAHLGRPYYRRDTSAGGHTMFIYYHHAFDSWFIGEQLQQGSRISFAVQSSDAPDSPEKAAWPQHQVQEIIDKSDVDLSGAADQDPSLFVDRSFPHSTSSVNRPGHQQVNLPHGRPQWVPGRKLRDARWKLFDGIDPRDLLQGSVGNCWLIAAMATLAEFPQEIQRIFVRDGLRKGDGRYVVQLFDHKEGAVKEVIVDEYIPCKPKNWWDAEAEPYFAHPNGNELWCLILEKAMAKVWGSYGDLHGGTPAAAFRALTGHKEQILWKVDARRSAWAKSALADGELNLFTSPSVGQETKGSNDFFEHLHQCDQQNFLMAASITGGREAERPDGLFEGHAYSIIQVVSLSASDRTRLRLLNLRNPWGKGKEWNGNWCDKHPLWERYPEVRRHLRPTFVDDGAFWMDFESFARAFSNVSICHKAMREGAEASFHSLVSTDYTKFRPQLSGPKPPSHSMRPAPAEVDGCKKLLHAALRATGHDHEDLLGCRWQIELGDAWQDLDDDAQVAIATALARGEETCRLRARGNDYEVDMRRLVQRNVKSGKERRLRAVPPEPERTAFVKGQAVHIYSQSSSSWEQDGTVVQVLERSGQADDGHHRPAGSVKVVYGGGQKSKWVEPAHFSTTLRAAAPARAGAADGHGHGGRLGARRTDPTPAAAAAAAAGYPGGDRPGGPRLHEHRQTDAGATAAARPAHVEADRLSSELQRAINLCPSAEWRRSVVEKVQAGAKIVLDIRPSGGGWEAVAELTTVSVDRRGFTTKTTTRTEKLNCRWHA